MKTKLLSQTPRRDSNPHNPITATGLEDQTDTRGCLNCNELTSNPKFCSRPCAATYNNKLFPKRSVESICRTCKTPISRARTFCKQCWYDYRRDTYIVNTTKGDLCLGNALNYGYPQIRNNARKTYLRSDKPKCCTVCSYSLHFDVCHITPVKEFPMEATVAEINSLENLTALCKNHHWEFDNGYRTL